MDSGGNVAQQNDGELISRVVYLASLASDPRAIDAKLDILRGITATHQSGQSLAPEERARLQQLHAQLEDYLLHHDPIRHFAPEALNERVASRGGFEAVRALRSGLGITWGIALAAAALAFLLPLSLLLRASIALPVFIIVMHMGGAWFYWSALRDFRPDIRRAYGYIVAGIVLIGLTSVQFPFITATRLGREPVGLYGGTLPVFAFAIFLFYLAMRAIAVRLDVRSLVRSPWFVGAGTVVVALGAALLPHTAVRYEHFFDISLASDLLVALYCGCAGILAWKISRSVAVPYARAMRFFSYTMAVAAVNVTWYGACLFVFGELTIGRLMLAMAPHGLTEIMLMSSGYIFRKNVDG